MSFLQLSRTVHWVLVSEAPGLWHHFIHWYSHTQLHSEVKCRRLSSCTSLGSQHCSSGLKAPATWNHRPVAAQQTWDPITRRCVRPRKGLGLLPACSQGSWDSSVPRHQAMRHSAQGCYQLCVIGMDSTLETLNAETLHRERRWLKKFIWPPLNCSFMHVPAMSVTKKT